MDLEALSKLAQTLSRDQFIARVNGLFLAVSSSSDPLTMAFRTQIARPGPAPKRGTLSAVYPLVKAPGNPYPERISVGRAPNCDIVLRVASVSKLHAHLLVRPGRSANVVYDLVDLGSHNGTSVNGRALKKNEPKPVTAGDLLEFGEVSAELIDAETLHGLLD